MTRTRFCDCAVFHTLVRAHQRVLAEGSGLRLVLPEDGAVPRILALTGIDRFIPCFASLDDALAQAPDGADPDREHEDQRRINLGPGRDLRRYGYGQSASDDRHPDDEHQAAANGKQRR